MATDTFSSFYLGIDPGKRGACVVLGESMANGVVDIVEFLDMPICRNDGKKVKKHGAGELDIDALAEWIALRAESIKWAVVEKVHACPRDGKVGAFNFGFQYGAIITILKISGIKIRYANPAVWKSGYGLSGGLAQKSSSVILARRYFKGPLARDALSNPSKHDGRAEAALLAGIGVIRPFSSRTPVA